MIAVFTKTHAEFKELQAIPKEMFVRIQSIDDIRGRKFIGIIQVHGWWNNNEHKRLVEAYEVLEVRQPELFLLDK